MERKSRNVLNPFIIATREGPLTLPDPVVLHTLACVLLSEIALLQRTGDS